MKARNSQLAHSKQKLIANPLVSTTSFSSTRSAPAGRLFLGGLLRGLGDLAGLVDLDDGLDDADGNGLAHVTDGEAAERRVLGEGLDAHGLGRHHLDDSGVAGLDELGAGFDRLARAAVDLLDQLRELAGDVRRVAVENGSVAGADLAWVVQDDDLGVEGLSTLWRIVLGVTAHITTADFLDRNVLDVEADVVTGLTFDELFVVHFDGLDFSGDTSRSKGDDHTGLNGTGFNTADGHCSDTTDLVHILERKAERLVGRAAWRINGVDGLEEGLAGDLGLGLLLPTLVPWTVGGRINHVVTIEAGDGNERNMLRVVADLLNEVGSFLDDFVVTILGPLGGVHLVDGDDELLDTKGVGKKSVLTGLAILGDTSFELTSTSGDDKNGAVSLGGASDHVLDEITVAWGVDDGDIVPRGFELPESDIDGDTTLTLSLELVEHPSVLEGALSEFSGFLWESVSILNFQKQNIALLMNFAQRCAGAVRWLSVSAGSGGHCSATHSPLTPLSLLISGGFHRWRYSPLGSQKF